MYNRGSPKGYGELEDFSQRKHPRDTNLLVNCPFSGLSKRLWNCGARWNLSITQIAQPLSKMAESLTSGYWSNYWFGLNRSTDLLGFFLSWHSVHITFREIQDQSESSTFTQSILSVLYVSSILKLLVSSDQQNFSEIFDLEKTKVLFPKVGLLGRNRVKTNTCS